MGVEQFVTTYRKDYLWPYIRTFGLKPEPEKLYCPQHRDDNLACECHCQKQPAPTNEQLAILGPKATSEQSWSRLGPMGPLLDPKLYPAKVGVSPEVETMRFNQPNVFLKKLHDKYPYIYECLKNAPPDDLIARINKDRLRTTYQVDYCKMMEYPSAPYDELIRAAGVEGLAPCPEPVRLPGDPCRPNQKPVAFRPGVISKTGPRERKGMGATSMGGERRGESSCAGSSSSGLTGLTPGATEYQDNISKLGQLIIRDKIHYVKREPGRLH